ncbi:MAG: DUF2398 family protein [Acutalibacter sp.]
MRKAALGWSTRGRRLSSRRRCCCGQLRNSCGGATPARGRYGFPNWGIPAGVANAARWSGWGRRLRELPQEKLAQELVAYMAGWMLLEERDEGFLLYPAVGKWIGHYPAGYQGGPGEEKWDEPLEDA